MNETTRQLLKHIVENADLLKKFAFEEHIKKTGLGFRIDRENEETFSVEFGVPDDKELRAVIGILRFFYRGNEPASFTKLHEIAKKDPSLSSDWQKGSKELQEQFASFMDGYSDYSVNLFEGHPSRREMFFTAMDSGFDHFNKSEPIAKRNEWTRDDIRASIFLQEITVIILVIIYMIYRLGEISRHELEQ
jgi:hypothetical protein